MYLVSIIMPTYNAEQSVGRALQSVLNTFRYKDFEIIVVDDCSKDNTLSVVREYMRDYPNIQLISMPENTGSPSGPRNTGIEHATGEFVAFLDDDDQYHVGNMLRMLDYARENQIDFVKGYLKVVKSGQETVSNRLPLIPSTSFDTIQAMISFQSTTQDFIVRRSILQEYHLRYPTDLKIGEDTVFVASILVHCAKVKYIDSFYLYYNQTAMNMSSVASTQHWGEKEVNDQITAWQQVQQILKGISIDYYKHRLSAGFRNLLINLVRFGAHLEENTFFRLHYFAKEAESYLTANMNLHARYQDLYQAILSGSYGQFLKDVKLRLLVAGYDLKFILPVIPYLSDQYLVQVDEWSGHNSHEEKASRRLCQWADIIWCEWLLGNAVYYTRHKNPNQRLLIRAHRFELTREFGFQVDYSKVDMLFTVGYYYFEKFVNQFHIPRHKMRLLPNYVENTIYSTEKSPQSRYHIGLVGVLPARKGFYRGLELLKMLRDHDERFQLYIMGQSPQEVSWIKNNPSEAEYYHSCDRYIEDHQLTDAVVYGGYVEREKLYTDIGYVLSLSDAEFPESFHLAPAEGAVSGAMGLLLYWPGVEYIYPPDVICSSIDEIFQRILEASQNTDIYDKNVSKLREHILAHYSMDDYLKILKQYLKQLFIL